MIMPYLSTIVTLPGDVGLISVQAERHYSVLLRKKLMSSVPTSGSSQNTDDHPTHPARIMTRKTTKGERKQTTLVQTYDEFAQARKAITATNVVAIPIPP